MAQYASLKNIAFPYCVVRLLQIETEKDTCLFLVNTLLHKRFKINKIIKNVTTKSKSIAV